MSPCCRQILLMLLVCSTYLWRTPSTLTKGCHSQSTDKLIYQIQRWVYFENLRDQFETWWKGKDSFCFSDIDIMKLQLDLPKEKEQKEAADWQSDGNCPSKIHNLTDELDNIIKQQETSCVWPLTFVPQQDERVEYQTSTQQVDEPEKKSFQRKVLWNQMI